MSKFKWLVFCTAILLPGLASAQSMRLQDAPLGSVVQIGSFNYIKIAENKYMQSAQVTCPDSATVGGMYVKCFKDKSAYESACSGSGNCDCEYTSIGDVDTTGGTGYDVYTYECDIPCYTPNATYDSTLAKCVCNESGYSYVHAHSTAGNGYACVPLSSLDIYTSGINFDYTGNVQTFTAPIDGTYKLEVWGAQGGTTVSAYSRDIGGYGGYSYGNIYLSTNDVLYVVVGQVGGSIGGTYDNSIVNRSDNAYNGGGKGSGGTGTCHSGSGGGGATHIATAAGVLSSLSSNQAAVLIVGGGGGGAGGSTDCCGNATGCHGAGGQGGGYIGGNGVYVNSSRSNTAGTQSTGGSSSGGTLYNGSFGKGGNDYSAGGGGGGGWYGGSGSYTSYYSGGGGSGYLNQSRLITGSYGMYCNTSNTYTKCQTSDAYFTYSSTTSNTTATANTPKQGNGYARITLISVD